jgi:hypothetical protein
MADNVAVTPGAGTTIATDDVGGIHYQRVKLDMGGDGSTVPLITALDAAAGATDPVLVAGVIRDDALAALTPADGDYTALRVDSLGTLWTRQPPSVVVSASPTLDTVIYAAGDSLHTAVITFASAVRVSGGTGRVRKVIVIDKDLQSAAGELWLFSATVTPAAANAAHSISDADAALCIGVIPFGTYYASALNSVSVASPDLPINCAATTLFGILVTRGTPTYTAAGLTVALQIAQD